MRKKIIAIVLSVGMMLGIPGVVSAETSSEMDMLDEEIIDIALKYYGAIINEDKKISIDANDQNIMNKDVTLFEHDGKFSLNTDDFISVNSIYFTFYDLYSEELYINIARDMCEIYGTEYENVNNEQMEAKKWELDNVRVYLEHLYNDNKMLIAWYDYKEEVASKKHYENNAKYDNIIDCYWELYDSMKDPNSLEILGVVENKSSYNNYLIFKHLGTNSFGGTVTEYALFDNGKLQHGNNISNIGHIYYDGSNTTSYDWSEIVDYSNSDACKTEAIPE